MPDCLRPYNQTLFYFMNGARVRGDGAEALPWGVRPWPPVGVVADETLFSSEFLIFSSWAKYLISLEKRFYAT